jgi:hypothetical protein
MNKVLGVWRKNQFFEQGALKLIAEVGAAAAPLIGRLGSPIAVQKPMLALEACSLISCAR